MGSASSLGGSGRPESRPVNMPMPCAEISSRPQTRVKQTHQTHQTHPTHPSQTSANSPDEIIIESTTYHVSGEFGEFHPAAPGSLGRKYRHGRVTTEPSGLGPTHRADVHASTDVENDIQLEMPMDHVIKPFSEAQPEA